MHRYLGQFAKRRQSESYRFQLGHECLEDRKMMAAGVFYYSPAVQREITSSDGSVLVADDADIVKLTIRADDTYHHETFFDGSDVGLDRSNEGISSFTMLPDGDLLMTIDSGRFSVPGLSGGDEDIFRFDPRSLGNNTQGRFSQYFDGSDVGLTRSIDGLHALNNGNLILSMSGATRLNGATYDDEDLLLFTPTRQLGTSFTRGNWSKYFDGSDVGLADAPNPHWEDINAIFVDESVRGLPDLYASVVTKFTAANLSGGREDVALFDPTRLGENTAGRFRRLVVDGDELGMPNVGINALHIPQGVPTTGPSIKISDVRQVEGDSGGSSFVFEVVLSEAPSETVRVHYATADGTATVANRDYVSTKGVLTWGPGNKSKRRIHVRVMGDRSVEPDENFSILLTNPQNATIADDRGVGTIINDDVNARLPEIRISDARGVEGQNFTFNVSLSKPSAKTVRVNYRTANGTATTADKDYSARNGVLVWKPGDTSTRRITVPVLADKKTEPNENFFVQLQRARNASIAGNRGVGTIVNGSSGSNDVPDVTVTDVRMVEGDSGGSTFVFTVGLSEPPTKRVRVNYTTSDGSATVADNDYVPTNGSFFWGPGNKSKRRVRVRVKGDVKSELDENFFVRLTSVENANITDNRGTGTIVNDDATAPLPSIRITDVRRAEGQNGTTAFTFSVSLSKASNKAVRVNFATADGTATLGDKDYESIRGAISWAPGNKSTQKISVRVRGDLKQEPNENFFVRLSGAQNATLEDGQGIGTIVNDDSASPRARKVFFYSLARDRNVTNSNGSTIRINQEDIVKMSLFEDDTYRHEIYFDGSDVGLSGEDVKAYTVLNSGEILVAISGEPTINGNRVYDEDIMKFTPRSLGSNTAGTWSVYFDGSDVGLGPNTDGIRTSIAALATLPDGDLLMSLRGVNIAGFGRVESQDLVRFNPVRLGTATRGSFEMYFDGSDADLTTSGEAVNALAIVPRSNPNLPELHLSTANRSRISGVTHTPEDVVSYLPNSLGTNTRGSYRSQRVFDGSEFGLNFGDVDAFFERL